MTSSPIAAFANQGAPARNRRRVISGMPMSPFMPVGAWSREPDARIEDGVTEVDQQADGDDHGRDQQHQRLHDRVIAPEDGVDRQTADARPGEDDLDDDGATDEIAELEADQCDHW